MPGSRYFGATPPNFESGFQKAYEEDQNLRKQLNTLESRNKEYETHVQASNATIQNLSTQNTTLTKALAEVKGHQQGTDHATPQRRKRTAKDPTPFDGKGSPTEKQEKYEIWETKILGVFSRDSDCFKNTMEEILYISDMLTDKAYEYIKRPLNTMQAHPTDISKWVFGDRNAMLEHLRVHYKTVDTSQLAKNKLDSFNQGERNYWSWKAELDELMAKANKTEEQKVELLNKNVSAKMKNLVVTLNEQIDEGDYTK